MELTSLGRLIAEREFSVVGGIQKVSVQLGAPQPFDEASGYYCPYRIVGLGSDKIRYAAGVDAFQALRLVMLMIGATIESRAKETGLKLTWEGEENLGFPTE